MAKIDKKAFGEYIKDKRIERGYTQEEFAERLNVSNVTVSKWENGKRYPDFEMVYDIACVLSVSVEEIYENSKREEGSAFAFNINIGGFVAAAIIMGVIAGRVLEPAKENNKELETEIQYGVYVNIDDEALPYIDVSEQKIIIGDSATDNYEFSTAYQVTNNKIKMLNYNEDTYIPLANSEKGDEYIEIGDGYLEYAGIRYDKTYDNWYYETESDETGEGNIIIIRENAGE